MNRTTALLIVAITWGIFAQDVTFSSTKPGAYMIQIDLTETARSTVSDQLNALLANEYVLYTKTQKYHWNVVGPFFGPLHDLFGKQYEQLAVNIDTVAERVRALGFIALGTLQEFQQHATIQENPGINPDAKDMIKDLLEGHEAIIRQIRPIIDTTVESNDMGTNNFLGDLIEQHEKTAWMLRAHLQ